MPGRLGRFRAYLLRTPERAPAPARPSICVCQLKVRRTTDAAREHSTRHGESITRLGNVQERCACYRSPWTRCSLIGTRPPSGWRLRGTCGSGRTLSLRHPVPGRVHRPRADVERRLHRSVALAVCASLRTPCGLRRAAAAARALERSAGLSLTVGRDSTALAGSAPRTREVYLVIGAGLGRPAGDAHPGAEHLASGRRFAAFADVLHGATTARSTWRLSAARPGQRMIARACRPTCRAPSGIIFPCRRSGMADFVFLAFFFACVFRFDRDFQGDASPRCSFCSRCRLLVASSGPSPRWRRWRWVLCS